MVGTAGRSGGNRQPKRVDTTKHDGLPELPIGRSEEFAAKWRDVLDRLPSQSLRRIDQVQLVILVDLLLRIEELQRQVENNPENYKGASLHLRISQHVSRLSAQFGLSPGDRQRLNTPPEPDEEDDPLAELIARQNAGRGIHSGRDILPYLEQSG